MRQTLTDTIESFVEEVRADGKKGMWVHGSRRSGTTTCARKAVDRLIEEFPDLVKKHGQGQRMSATALSARLRSVWTQESLMRMNADDMLLWQETSQLLDNWEFLWNCSILFIDDLIEVDIPFWKKHILPRIDQRVKSNTITIIAGVLTPQSFGPAWEKGLVDLFKVYRLDDVR